VINGNRPGYALSSLAIAAGCTRGRDRMMRAFLALAALKKQLTDEHGPNPQLVLWMQNFRELGLKDQEEIFFLIHTAAMHLEMRVRMVALIGHVHSSRGLVPCLFSARLRATELKLTRAGLEGTGAQSQFQAQMEARRLA
jgi:hypothetical protein